eukprot:1224631-Amphidinium_carterae.1
MSANMMDHCAKVFGGHCCILGIVPQCALLNEYLHLQCQNVSLGMSFVGAVVFRFVEWQWL